MRFLSTLIASVLAFALSAQRYYFENISLTEDLPSSKVYCVLQDSTGLVWLGTESGLASFDGTNVVAFGPNQGMAPRGVRSLFLDKDKRLWCGHLGGGISISQGRKFQALIFSDSPITSDVTGISQAPDGSVWIATFGMGVLHVKDVPADGNLVAERFADSKGPGDRLSSLVKRKNGDLVFLDASNGLRQLRAGGSAFEPFAEPALADLPGINSFFEDAAGNLWAGTNENGALKIDPKSGKTTTYDIKSGLPDNLVNGFAQDGFGNVWISVWDKGLVQVETTGLRLFNASAGLHSSKVRSMLRDREGNLLIATHDEGLDIYKGDRFLSFTTEDGLIERHVTSVAEAPDGRLWFGTFDGISVLDPSASGAFSVRPISMKLGAGLTDNSISSLIVDREGRVYIGTDDGGLLGSVGDGSSIIPIPISGELGNNRVTALAHASRGGIYVGTLGGVVHFVPGGFTSKLDKSDGIVGNDVTALFTDPKGRTWIGTDGGVCLIENSSAKKAVPVDLGTIVVPSCFTQDAAGRIWVGTQDQGIYVVEDKKLVATYDVSTGLLSNNIRSLITDENGHVWIGTSAGLNERAKDGTSFLAYTERSGFTGIEASPDAAITTRAGDIWFGTANGGVKVVVDHGQDLAEPPLIAVRVLKVNLEERDAIDGVDLSHTERDVRIEFGCVSLSDQGAVRYQFMLEGLEKDWQPVQAETDAHYPGLSPGKYVFKVRARNRAGIWSDPPVLYHFTVLPPWYRSWWFYSAVALASAIVLFSYIKVRERQLRTRNQELEEKVEQRTAEVVAQSKEIEGQKGRIEGLLLNILPKVISDELNEKGKATARMHPEVTVMFTDMKGFTRVAEKMTPEELVRELDECFIQIDRIVGRYGIEKIKTIGDSYMCASGIPQSDPWHAHKMLLAALEIREMMARWCRQREALGKEPWVLRIGIHTGPVVAGVVGKRKFAYDIWGDTVNTASRMESSGATGEVNISGRTFELIKGDFVCEYRGKVEAKNKGLIDMYFVRRIDPELSADANGVWADASYLRSLGLTQLIEELA